MASGDLPLHAQREKFRIMITAKRQPKQHDPWPSEAGQLEPPHFFSKSDL